MSGISRSDGAGHWRTDVRGALVYASSQIMKRDAKVTSYVWNFVDLVEGHPLQLTNNADKSLTFAGIYMHKTSSTSSKEPCRRVIRSRVVSAIAGMA